MSQSGRFTPEWVATFTGISNKYYNKITLNPAITKREYNEDFYKIINDISDKRILGYTNATKVLLDVNLSKQNEIISDINLLKESLKYGEGKAVDYVFENDNKYEYSFCLFVVASHAKNQEDLIKSLMEHLKSLDFDTIISICYLLDSSKNYSKKYILVKNGDVYII